MSKKMVKCKKCGVEFPQKGARKKCFECQPPEMGHKARRDGKLGDAGIALDVSSNIARRRLGDETIISEEYGIPDELMIDKVEQEARRMIDIRARKGKEMWGKSVSGDRVILPSRPKSGWGKCRHLDVKERREVCDKERMYLTNPFCEEHFLYWREKRVEMRAKKVLDEVVSEYEFLEERTFKFKSPKDVVEFLGKVNYGVFKEWMAIGKARALTTIAQAQLRAFESVAAIERLRRSKGEASGDVRTPEGDEEAEELRLLEKKMGRREERGMNGAEVDGRE